MKDTELRNRLAKILESKATDSKSYPKRFTAKELAKEVDGSATRVGHVKDLVCQDLTLKGINITYKRHASAWIFEITESS